MNEHDDERDERTYHGGEQRCQFPGRCCMPGLHDPSECHTADMLEDCERECADGERRCGHCSRPTPNAGGVCDDPKCVRYEREYEADCRRAARRERCMAIWYALRDRCGDSDETCGRWRRWFYTFKAVVCLLLNLRGSGFGNPDHVSGVALWDFRSAVGEYSGSDWTELSVGRGVFRNWRYGIYGNGSY